MYQTPGCQACAVRNELDTLREKSDAEHGALGSVLISDGGGPTIVRIFKPISDEHRRRLVALLCEIHDA